LLLTFFIFSRRTVMRKSNKRLTLHRETLRSLDEVRLQGAVGGTGFTHDPGNCRTSCRCLDFMDTFSADCTAGCPATSMA
jgi:hypothetical protein